MILQRWKTSSLTQLLLLQLKKRWQPGLLPLFSDSNNKNWNIEIWYLGFSQKLLQWNKPKRSHDMDLGAKQVVLWRICSQLQCQSKMTEIPEEAFVMDCIEYDAVAEKINRRCPQCLDLNLNYQKTRHFYWCIPGMLQTYTIPK